MPRSHAGGTPRTERPRYAAFLISSSHPHGVMQAVKPSPPELP